MCFSVAFTCIRQSILVQLFEIVRSRIFPILESSLQDVTLDVFKASPSPCSFSVTTESQRYPAEVQKRMAQEGCLVPGGSNKREDAEIMDSWMQPLLQSPGGKRSFGA